MIDTMDRPDWDVDDVLSGTVPAAELLADCLAGLPGAGRVQMLSCVNSAVLTEGERLDYLRCVELQLRWLHAEHAVTLAEIAAADTSDLNWSQEAVGTALNLSPSHAGSMLHESAALVADLPLTTSALRTGQISLRHAHAIRESSLTIDPALHGALEQAVLTKASGQTVPELRRSLLRAAVTLDAEAAERRRCLARSDRRIEHWPAPDGMAEIRAHLTADAAAAVWQRITSATRLLPTEDIRTLDQQRADLLVDAVLTGIGHDMVPTQQGHRPSVNVVIGLSTLMGSDDEPADLSGYGAITAQLGRELAADPTATWRRFVCDPVTGELLDYGSTTYAPPQRLRDFVLARSPMCVFPGCNAPSYRCDLDHRVAFAAGGSTSAANMDPLCRRHHEAKTRKEWSYEANSDGSRTWTSRTGHSYVAHPPQRWQLPAADDGPGGPSDNSALDRGGARNHRPVTHYDITATASDRAQQRAEEVAHEMRGLARPEVSIDAPEPDVPPPF